MSVEVLKSKVDIGLARAELRRRKLSFTSAGSWWFDLARKLRVSTAVKVGDTIKSWDVLRTADFILANVPKVAPVLDIGAYASELLFILYEMGYSNLAGIDLNPDVKRMPLASHVRYEVSDFMHAPFESGSFTVITAISVIEHGFNGNALLAEVSRLLRPGGFFIASFDYWPEKVNTTGVSFFGMEWMIFSAQEVRDLVSQAAVYDLQPHGELNLEAQERPIGCAGKNYTFAWTVLQKSPGKNENKEYP